MNSKRKVKEIVKECTEEEIVGKKVTKRSVKKCPWKYEGNNDAGNTLKDGENVQDAPEAKAHKRTKVDVEDAREAKSPKRTKVDGENVEDARDITDKITKKERFVTLGVKIVTGCDRDLELDEIVSHAKTSDGEHLFWVKWKGSPDVEIVPLKLLDSLKNNTKLLYDYFIDKISRKKQFKEWNKSF